MAQENQISVVDPAAAFSLSRPRSYRTEDRPPLRAGRGGSIELANVNGEIGITTSGGTAVEIKAVKKSDHKGEIENVDVVFEPGKDKLKVYVKYSKRNARAKVDFTVSVPEKLARAIFKSVNGRIDCSGKFADLTLKTVNGKIDFAGGFRTGTFKTVNGAIEISQEPLLSGDLTRGDGQRHHRHRAQPQVGLRAGRAHGQRRHRQRVRPAGRTPPGGQVGERQGQRRRPQGQGRDGQRQHRYLEDLNSRRFEVRCSKFEVLEKKNKKFN